LRDLGEHCVAQLAERRAEKTQHAVAHQQQHRQHEHGARLVERVDDFLEHQRHRHVGELGHDQQRHGQRHAPLNSHR